MNRKNRNTGGQWNNHHDRNAGHLRRHVHLTNCIHIRHHWHMQKARMKLDLAGSRSESSLAHELHMLENLHSLRDPSTNPKKVNTELIKGKTTQNGLKPVYTRIMQECKQKQEKGVNPGSKLQEAYNVKGERTTATVLSKAPQQHFIEKSGKRKDLKSSSVVGVKVIGQSIPGDIQAICKSNLREATLSIDTGKKYQKTHQKAQSKTIIAHEGALDNVGFDELEISHLPRKVYRNGWNWSQLQSTGKSIIDPISVHSSDADQSSSLESMSPTSSYFTDTTDTESYRLHETGSLCLSASHSESRINEDNPPEQEQFSTVMMQNIQRKCFQGPDNNHQTLSQKYAPMSLTNILGQNLVIQALSNALSKGRVAPMYIFYGPSGTGKTLCARLFAQALNCLSSKDPKPCGCCTKCLAHNLWRTSNFKEFNVGREEEKGGIRTLMRNVSQCSLANYQVYVLDECHHMSSWAWNAFLKVAEVAPSSLVIVLSTNSLEQLPQHIVSRCQKFLFLKIKESDIFFRLHWISMQEGLEVEPEALRLIASISDGSLQDAEMKLDQLSLLGQKISVSLVQQLMGIVPDDDLVDLLDFALSADIVNTIRQLKRLTMSGVEPLSIMSQLAGMITSILGGSNRIPPSNLRQFFGKQELTNEDVERLRQALKVLSEAEKQSCSSVDPTTGLTAALLQFAPNQSFFTSNITTQEAVGPKEATDFPWVHHTQFGLMKPHDVISDLKSVIDPMPLYHPGHGEEKMHEEGMSQAQSDGQTVRWHTSLSNGALEKVWRGVLDAMHSNSLRKFLQIQGKLLSISLCKGFLTALIEISQPEHVSRAEHSKISIAHAFQVTVGYPVNIKLKLASDEGKFVSANRASSSNSLCQPLWTPEACSPVFLKSKAKQEEQDMTSYNVSLEAHHQAPRMPSHHQRNMHRKIFEQRPVHPSCAEMLLKHPCVGNVPKEGSNDHKSMLGNSISKIKRNHNDALHVASNNTLRNSASHSFITQQSQGGDDGCSRKKQFVHMTGGWIPSVMKPMDGDLNCTAGCHMNLELADEIEEQNLRLESRSGGHFSWNAAQQGYDKVEEVFDGSRKQGLLQSLCPCAKYHRS